jgi:zinc/manganese transport system permease protein
MRDALIGGTIVALAAGLIGYFVVVRHTAFAAHALAHIGLPGATGAVLLGVPVIVGLGVFCVGGALVIGALGKRAWPWPPVSACSSTRWPPRARAR